MLTHGWGCPANHPQFRAINCCQLRIGSCRPDLCRILGAFLHFPDNPNCGSLVICGGGKPPPSLLCAFAMCTIAGKGMTKVPGPAGRDRENTEQKPSHPTGKTFENRKQKPPPSHCAPSQCVQLRTQVRLGHWCAIFL